MRPSFASLFSGFGLADVGAKKAGCDLLWGVELDPAIADVSRQLGHDVICRSVTEVDFSTLEKPTVLWASPPCPNFSIAKTNGVETAADIDLAKAVVRAIETLEPQYFILENVQGYQRSKSLALIENALYSAGYWIDRQVLNSADFGVPQTRRRLILRAVKGGFVPALPDPVKWIGWYEAIEDLIPSLPESQFAEWQLKRLPDELIDSILVPGGNASSFSVRSAAEPSRTIGDVGRVGNISRAFLVDKSINKNGESVTIDDRDRPSFTVKASASKQASRAWLERGRVVAMTARALARFQSLPDWYELPTKNTLACRGIGNGVPCLMAKGAIESLIGQGHLSASV